MTTTEVDNWPGDVEGLQGPELMERMRRHAERFETEIVNDHVQSVDLSQRPFRLKGDTQHYTCDALIIATGATAKYLGLPSEEKFRGRGVSACATCDGFFFRGQRVAVIGGGNTAVEEALYLSHIAAHVTLVHRRDKLRAEKILQDRLFREVESRQDVGGLEPHGRRGAGRSARRHRRAPAVRQHGEQHARAATITGCSSPSATRPTPRIFNGQLDDARTATSRSGAASRAMRRRPACPGVFAAGDVADHVYRQAITSAGAGCMAALDADRYLETLDMEKHVLTQAPPGSQRSSPQHRRARSAAMECARGERAIRSCAMNFSPRWSTRAASAPARAGSPRYITLTDEHGTGRGRARFRQDAFLRRVRV